MQEASEGLDLLVLDGPALSSGDRKLIREMRENIFCTRSESEVRTKEKGYKNCLIQTSETNYD